MIAYRNFLNSDPPALVRLWNQSQPLQLRLPQVNARLLDAQPLGRLYFDPHGFWVAEHEGRIVGFAHAGFGPNHDGSALDPHSGSISQLLVEPSDQAAAVAAELIARCEQYLFEAGAETITAGGVSPVDPFYHGMYGGARSSGLLAADTAAREWFAAAGFTVTQTWTIQQRMLQDYRAPLGRELMTWRRQAQVTLTSDPPPKSWWEASTYGQHGRQQFELTVKSGPPRRASLLFWDIQPLAGSWGTQSAGLLAHTWDAEATTDGLASYLIAESMKQLREKEVRLVELQATADDAFWRRILSELGFEEVDQALVMHKRKG